MTHRSSRRQRNAPTISDVAAAAGVSPMTVSRVINGESNVRESTRALVNEVIRKLNYAPSAAARSLAGGEEVRIGLLYSNPSSAYLSEFLVGSLDQAARSNVQLVVEKCDEDALEQSVIDHLVQGRVDGIVLPPPLCDAKPVLAAVAEHDIPAVAVATGRPAETMAAVSIDDRRAAFDMTRHLIELGHRRIGFIIGNPNQTASAERLAGYRAALEQAAIAGDDGLVVQGLFTYRSGLDAAERLLTLAEVPTAIFASNDDMAAAAVAVAHRRGLDVPRDLTVCGFDDTALATTIWPELTTIRQPIVEMSRTAVELLVREIKDRKNGKSGAPQHLVLDFDLVRRQSDAPPRG
ncbi:MAG: LacI family DNA-binding transcriptional regulator [Sphingomonas sp.]|uniref:LacI family DNA-binding transcriptional regulator n=1 Tax=Sphingomonas sp. TaxID=28214 RepID=UPI003F80F3DE